MRSTVTDIAREAGVSSATVDRVLNNRNGVRERTREIVLETARRLGYIDDVIMPHGTRRRLIRALKTLKNKTQENPWKKHDNIPL